MEIRGKDIIWGHSDLKVQKAKEELLKQIIKSEHLDERKAMEIKWKKENTLKRIE